MSSSARRSIRNLRVELKTFKILLKLENSWVILGAIGLFFNEKWTHDNLAIKKIVALGSHAIW